MKLTNRFLLFVGIIAAFASCTKIYDDSIHRNILQGISLDSTSVNMYVGEERQMSVVTRPSDYSLDSLKWHSSDTAVLSITNKGFVTAKAEGTSTVTISDLDSTVSVRLFVTVTKPMPDSLEIGLLAYYPFNGSVADSSGNNYNGTAFNILPTTDRFNKPTGAYQFNGTSSYITIDDSQALRLNNTDFTLSMWVKLDTYIAESGSSLLSKNIGANQQGWNCSIVGTDNHDGAAAGNLFYNVSGGLDPFAVGDAVVDTVGWHLLTITYELETKKISLYVDGMHDADVTEIPTPNPAVAAKLHIGNNSYLDVNPLAKPYYFHGKMDDIRIYNRRLTGYEISKLYALTE